MVITTVGSDIVGAWLDADTVNLLLTEPCPNTPAPWVADKLTWTLPADLELDDVDGQLPRYQPWSRRLSARHAPAARPGTPRPAHHHRQPEPRRRPDPIRRR